MEQQIGFPLAAAQRQALDLAVRSKVLVITGGPGVGKTTVVHAIVQVLKVKGLQIVLCAPTGRAAKRMSEATGQKAKTRHRVLEFDPTGGGFKRNHDNPLEGEVFMVDESSMLNLMLAHQFIRALPPQAALIQVDDVDQLPSVGPGSVLRELIDSGVVPVCRLSEIFRQAAQPTRHHHQRPPHQPEPDAPVPAGEGERCAAERLLLLPGRGAGAGAERDRAAGAAGDFAEVRLS